MFEIAVADDEHPAVERMWVIVRETTPDGYIGMLDNKPGSMAENDRFWAGSELPFDYCQVIAVSHADEASIALAKAPAAIPWIRSN